MQLTEEGIKELGQILNALEQEDGRYRSKLSGVQKKIIPFFKQEDCFDYIYDDYTSFISGVISKKVLTERFIKIIEGYYIK